MSKSEKIIKLASNCFFVKGATKNLIIDLQNNEWYHVDFELDSESEIDVSTLPKGELEYMLARQMLISIPSKLSDNFPKTDTSFEVPNIIEFAIMDRNSNSDYSIKKALTWLDSLIVKFCQIRFYSGVTKVELEEILNEVRESNLESLDLLLPYNEAIEDFLENAIEKNPKLNSIVFHSSTKNDNELKIFEKRRLHLKEVIINSNNCGIVHPSFFSSTKKHILKSMNFNSCLYKKIGIDIDGKIKNCPSMKSEIGNISNIDDIKITDLETEYWNIKKDNIEICRDCEFRYICFDCRVQVDHKNARPNTCIYNPYTNLWKGQEGYSEPTACNK